MITNINGKIGCEIEGIAKITNRRIIENLCEELNFVSSNDGSIRGDRIGEYSLEIKTKPYNLNELNQFIVDVSKILKLIRVNDTCGLHIHLSFNNIIDYYKLMTWDFVYKFQTSIQTLFKTKQEKNRLTNSYCKFYTDNNNLISNTTEQLQGCYKNNRYFAVNFNSFNLYKTIEFRIFAATNKETKFKKYLKFLINEVEEHLKTEIKLDFSGNTIYKEKKTNNKPIMIREIITKEELRNGN